MGEDRRDHWDFLTLAFWFVFFGIGLTPELYFSALRQAAAVAPRTALVNSSAVITVCFAVYLALFAFRRCRDAGLPAYLSQGKALEVALVALVAFLELPPMSGALQTRRTLLALLLDLGALRDGYLRAVILFVSVSKVFAWMYLLSLVIRYHAFGNRGVFTLVPSMFPSMNRAEHREIPATPRPSTEAPGAFTPPDRIRGDAPADAGPRAAGK